MDVKGGVTGFTQVPPIATTYIHAYIDAYIDADIDRDRDKHRTYTDTDTDMSCSMRAGSYMLSPLQGNWTALPRDTQGGYTWSGADIG